MGALDVVDRTFRRITMLAVLAALGGVGFGAFAWARGRVLSDLYRERLAGIAREYEALRSRYNEAVEKSAVTELVVEEGRIAVVVRGSDQVLRTLPTELDPKREVHVDFVVWDGRLFIRRLYDDQTAPKDGFLVDPKLSTLDWNNPALARGLSVYRGDLAEGRWVVTTSGNGALELTKVTGASPELKSAPPVRDYAQIEKELDEKAKEVGTLEVVGRLIDEARR